MKVYYLDDIPTPYRLGVLRTFNRNFHGIFRVGFCASEEAGRKWQLDLSDLETEVLGGYQWRPRGQVNPFSFKWNPSIIRVLKKFQPDAVIFSGYVHPTMQLGAAWCRKNSIPYGIACESSFLNSRSKGLKWIIKKTLFRPMVSNMIFGLPTGKKAEEYLRVLGAKTQPMYYFPNTPDIRPILVWAERIKDLQQRHTVLQKFGLPLDKRIILFVGRLIDAKRPLDLITAFQQLSTSASAIVVFVGDGPLREPIEQCQRECEGIHSLGWLSEPQDVYALMAVADLFVLPSAHEPWGAVVNEAMAAATPVIATDNVGAAHELIDNEITGFRYSTGNIEQLREIIAGLLTQPNRLKQLGSNAQTKARLYDQGYSAQNLLLAVNYAMEV